MEKFVDQLRFTQMHENVRNLTDCYALKGRFYASCLKHQNIEFLNKKNFFNPYVDLQNRLKTD